MSKAQYILLFATIGFYGLLCVSLFIRACVGLWQARRAAAPPRTRKTAGAAARKHHKAWTHAVWQGKLA